MARTADVVIIGGGIHGCSTALHLALRGFRPVLIEKDYAGRHASGVNAGGVRQLARDLQEIPLSISSMDIWERIEELVGDDCGFEAHGTVLVAESEAELAGFRERVDDLRLRGFVHEELIDAAELRRLVPAVSDRCPGGVVSRRDGAAIPLRATQAFKRKAESLGAIIREGVRVTKVEQDGPNWRVVTDAGDFLTPRIVNAAGAWADEVGRMAGSRGVGLVPKRRTAMIVAAPDGVDPGPWPMAVDIDEEFYLKPDAGRLLISPADETPSPPCDAQPEELDIAICIDRIERAFDLSVGRVENKWAGLRSFVADKTPVAGFDAEIEGLFWLAGQGGYGIQTAPALGRCAAALVLGRGVPDDIAAQGVTAAALSPSRLGRPA